MPINKEKYQEVILYLCQKLGGEIKGKKKLAKLLYFVDFDNYEKNGTSITGDTYFARQMGPLPMALAEITKSMQKKGTLEIQSIEEYAGYAPTEIYRCTQECQKSTHLSTQEKQMLDRVVKKYGGLTGTQLQELTHAEAPFTSAKINEEVPYEFTYYRGTDFSDLC
jgi:uncharacterized phage-associated protein